MKLPSSSTSPNPPSQPHNAPPPPNASKPDIAAALAPPASKTVQEPAAVTKPIPTGPKSGRIIPAVPLPSPSAKVPLPVNGAAIVDLKSADLDAPVEPVASKSITIMTKSIEEANRDARDAVALAMAKLPPAPGQKKPADDQSVMDNLTNKVNGMKTGDVVRTTRQPGTSNHIPGHRSTGRGSHRGGRNHSNQLNNKVEVPATDYDFESANAKFNKQDLVKEAIASGSAIGATTPSETPAVNGSAESGTNGERQMSEARSMTTNALSYNKSSSFFDNISSESKDRIEEGGNRIGGREFRNEERQKNLETFGQGSVDNGYRGGYGRGRGRGRGVGRGSIRGSYGLRGRGGLRGGRGPITSEG